MIQRAAPVTRLIDYETYRKLVEDGEKADLIDGVIYMASPDKKTNNTLNGLLYVLIEQYTAARDIDGFTFFSRFSCKLTDYRAPEPDVGYVRPERVHLVEENYMLGGPDIAVEIVSRDSRSRDYGIKRELYQTAGVAEYWIIDPLKSQTLFLRLEDEVYEPMELERGHIFRSSVIAGFWLDVKWLFAKPLPKAYHCLAEILKDKPRRGRGKRA
jgi:Uma2 family endonuclease